MRDGVKRGEVYRPSSSETYEGVNIRIGIGRTDAAPPSGNIRGRGKIRQQIHGHDQRRYDNDRYILKVWFCTTKVKCDVD